MMLTYLYFTACVLSVLEVIKSCKNRIQIGIVMCFAKNGLRKIDCLGSIPPLVLMVKKLGNEGEVKQW